MLRRMIIKSQMKVEMESYKKVIERKDDYKALDMLGEEIYVYAFTEEYLTKIKMDKEFVEEYRAMYLQASEIREKFSDEKREKRKQDIPRRIAALEKELKELKELQRLL